MEMFERVQAINILIPDADYIVVDDEEIIWNDSRAMPSDTDLQSTVDNLTKEYNDFMKSESCREWILKFYPLEKQNSDATDKAFWEPILKSNGYVDLENTVVVYVKRFVYDNEDFETIMLDEPEATRDAVGQLVKTGIRLNWVIDCKYALNDALANDTIPSFPEFPII